MGEERVLVDEVDDGSSLEGGGWGSHPGVVCSRGEREKEGVSERRGERKGKTR